MRNGLLSALGLGRHESAAERRDPERARALRDELVTVVSREVRDRRVLEAIRAVPRHAFAPGASLARAYGDRPIAIGHGATISQPTVVGLMCEALELRGHERVLEIGTGSGYQAAILSHLALAIDTIEIVPELRLGAARALASLGIGRVSVHLGDGWEGLAARAPFERIVVTAAPDVLPTALVDQLAEGGVLVVPVGPAERAQRLARFEKRHGVLRRSDLGAVRFVPMVHGD